MPDFLHGYWESKVRSSGACVASTFPSEPSPQPFTVFKLLSLIDMTGEIMGSRRPEESEQHRVKSAPQHIEGNGWQQLEV